MNDQSDADEKASPPDATVPDEWQPFDLISRLRLPGPQPVEEDVPPRGGADEKDE